MKTANRISPPRKRRSLSREPSMLYELQHKFATTTTTTTATTTRCSNRRWRTISNNNNNINNNNNNINNNSNNNSINNNTASSRNDCNHHWYGDVIYRQNFRTWMTFLLQVFQCGLDSITPSTSHSPPSSLSKTTMKTRKITSEEDIEAPPSSTAANSNNNNNRLWLMRENDLIDWLIDMNATCFALRDESNSPSQLSIGILSFSRGGWRDTRYIPTLSFMRFGTIPTMILQRQLRDCRIRRQQCAAS